MLTAPVLWKCKANCVTECANAILWKDACQLYFQQFSKRPIPYDLERPIHNLDDIIANEFKHKNE